MQPATADDARQTAMREVSASLRETPKRLPSKYLYDARGSRLFDEITRLPEYYPTRTELGILRAHAKEIAGALGPRCILIEPGAGTAEKAAILLEAMDDPAAFVPVEISESHLRELTEELRERFPDVEILPVCADFTQVFNWQDPRGEVRSHAAFFPGSTLGNLARGERIALLRRLAEIVGDGGAIILGIDLRKPEEILIPAYDDAQGVTEEFTRNILRHLNRLIGSDFDDGAFEYRAVYNRDIGRVEMQLVARRDQRIHFNGEQFAVAAGEPIITEHSHKFDLEAFEAEAAEAGLALERVWTDDRRWFAELLLRVDAGG